MSEENEFRDLFEKTQVNMSIKKGDKVSGPVVAIDKKYVFVDLGGARTVSWTGRTSWTSRGS